MTVFVSVALGYRGGRRNLLCVLSHACHVDFAWFSHILICYTSPSGCIPVTTHFSEAESTEVDQNASANIGQT